jgi:hypothetical protein
MSTPADPQYEDTIGEKLNLGDVVKHPEVIAPMIVSDQRTKNGVLCVSLGGEAFFVDRQAAILRMNRAAKHDFVQVAMSIHHPALKTYDDKI